MRCHTTIQGSPVAPRKLAAKHLIGSFRTAAGHRTHGIKQQLLVHNRERRQDIRHMAVQASIGSFGQNVKDVKEDPDSTWPDIPKIPETIK